MIALKTGLLAFLFLLSLLGLVLARAPVVGVPLFVAVAALAYAGLRLSRDARRRPLVRRLALAAGIFCALTGLAAVPFAFIESAHARFEDWHSAGAGLRSGMTLGEARGLLARRSVVTEFPVPESRNFKGVRFLVEPTGTARYKFSFPLAELHYLDVAVDEAGRVASVKSWSD